MAIVLQRPNDARGRPQKLLNQEGMYEKIFDTQVDRDLYVVCALLDRQVGEFVELQFGISIEDRRDTKYYVEMWLAATALKKAIPTPSDIASLRQLCVAGIPDVDLKDAVSIVHKAYKAGQSGEEVVDLGLLI